MKNEQSRLTTKKDIKKLKKAYNISSEQANLLFKICQNQKIPNISYILNDFLKIQSYFKTEYDNLKENGTSIEINTFFKLLYTMEQICAQMNKFSSTIFIPVSTVLFLITPNNEQLPFMILENNQNYFSVEVPDYIFSSNDKPEFLSKNKFYFKTKYGLSYNFISRFIRFENLEDPFTGKKSVKMVLSHTTEIQMQIQRHYHREFFSSNCSFSPIQINCETSNYSNHYIISSKKYQGKVNNLSGGGICIETPLPIREEQYMALYLTEFGIKEPIIGIIKRTRKLPNSNFSLHIQFLNLSLNAQNRILAYVYKYEL